MARVTYVLATLAVAMVLVDGCAGPDPSPSPPPVAEATVTPTAALPSAPSANALNSTSPSIQPKPPIDCPPLAFDANAQLGAIFAKELFERDESDAIASAYVTGLTALYAGRPDARPCDLFTRTGLATATAIDPRLAAGLSSASRLDGTLFYRARSEGTYDLRQRPPTVPLDIAFDIAQGARTTDVATGAVSVSSEAERVAFNVVFAYDGHRWRADRVGPPSPTLSSAWTRIPETPAPGPPCTGFKHDAPGAAFDDRAGSPLSGGPPRRRWCAEHGTGPEIRFPEQLVFWTQYPCEHGSIAVLTIGRPLGTTLDELVLWEYLRDPKGEAAAFGWTTGPYRAKTRLPADAADTGWTNGNVDLWISPKDDGSAVYLVRGTIAERWPRAASGWGVIDCN